MYKEKKNVLFICTTMWFMRILNSILRIFKKNTFRTRPLVYSLLTAINYQSFYVALHDRVCRSITVKTRVVWVRACISIGKKTIRNSDDNETRGFPAYRRFQNKWYCFRHRSPGPWNPRFVLFLVHEFRRLINDYCVLTRSAQRFRTVRFLNTVLDVSERFSYRTFARCNRRRMCTLTVRYSRTRPRVAPLILSFPYIVYLFTYFASHIS